MQIMIHVGKPTSLALKLLDCDEFVMLFEDADKTFYKQFDNNRN